MLKSNIKVPLIFLFLFKKLRLLEFNFQHDRLSHDKYIESETFFFLERQN